MHDEDTIAELDEEILEAALALLDGGQRPTREELVPHFPGREVAIEAVLDALRSYERQVAEQREPRGGLTGDDLLVPGTRIGDFVIERWIGGGG